MSGRDTRHPTPPPQSFYPPIAPGQRLPADGDALLGAREFLLLRPLGLVLAVVLLARLVALVVDLVGARAPVEEGALLDGAAGGGARRGHAFLEVGAQQAAGRGAAGADAHAADSRADAADAAARDGRRQVRDVLGERVLRAHGARVHAVGLARLGQRVVPAVEVLALLQVLRQPVRPRRELAVQPEQPLLLGGEGLEGGFQLVGLRYFPFQIWQGIEGRESRC